MGRENVVGEVMFHVKVLFRHVCQGLSQHRTLKQYSPGILTVLSCDQIIGETGISYPLMKPAAGPAESRAIELNAAEQFTFLL
jgi:hypothetical protein